ncbi:MAG: hypothetical protein KA204_01715 [Chromatiaceae bacterium]|nr:hypothetical protein [Chromatiaceae bacterium]MBP6733804.1 hypothetical protein [Chromatiaceae bacterium]MBP6806754.1 hypothetical protein [Chromatiaceae bacterium]MBP8288442.1 hypothetical protein [Chromatiaceae bacterium]MBP9602677.1 hypothetical protein [Chromatiaceae bacterium]
MTHQALPVADYLGHILAAIQRIRRYTVGKTYADFARDEQVQDAVVRNIETDFTALHPQIPWSAP